MIPCILFPNRLKTLEIHRFKVHGIGEGKEEHFICEICGYRAHYKQHLRRHVRIHSDERPFKCDECYKAFRYRGALKHHKLNMHTENSDKPYKCNVCHKAYGAKHTFVAHQLTHKPKGLEQVLQCDVCFEEFPRESLLRRHKRNKHL